MCCTQKKEKVMIRELFVCPRTISRLESSPLYPQLISLATAMKKERYTRGTIGKYLSICEVFGRWLAKNRIPLNTVTDLTTKQFLACPADSIGSKDKRWRSIGGCALHAFLPHLQE